MPTTKLTLKEAKEILAWKSKKGQFLSEDSTKRVSTYTVAEMYGVSHTIVHRIWTGKYKGLSEAKSDLDTAILKKLIPLFVQVANADVKGIDFPELTNEEQQRIGGLASE